MVLTWHSLAVALGAAADAMDAHARPAIAAGVAVDALAAHGIPLTDEDEAAVAAVITSLLRLQHPEGTMSIKVIP